jgi:branched-chain amino acid transport system substrate-binding protein
MRQGLFALRVAARLASAATLICLAIPAAAQDDPLVIGAVVAETGFMAQYDQPAWATAKMAIDDINAGKLAILGTSEPGLLGRQVSFVVRDYRTDRDLAPTAAQEVIDEGAVLLIASCDFDFGSPAALVAQDSNIVSMSLCAGSPRFGPEGGLELGFSAGSVAEATAAAASEWGFDKQGWKTAYLINDPVLQVDTDWSEGFRQRFTELAGDGAIIGEDTFRNNDANINAQITNLRNLTTQPDVIVLTSFPPGGASAARQIRAAGIDTPILMNDAMDGSTWWDTVPPDDRKDIYIAVRGDYFGNDPDARINDLTARYHEQTGEYPPSSLFVDGYGAIEMLALAVQQAGTTDGAAVADALEHFRAVDRVAGPATFNATLHDAPDRQVAILQLDGTEARIVARQAPTRVPKYADVMSGSE